MGYFPPSLDFNSSRQSQAQHQSPVMLILDIFLCFKYNMATFKSVRLLYFASIFSQAAMFCWLGNK